MKKSLVILLIISFAISIVFLLSGCGVSKEHADTTNNDIEVNPYSYALKEYNNDDIDLDDYQLIEILFDHYSMREIIEMRYGNYGEFFEYIGYPDVYLILDELDSQGYYNEIDNLRTMVEKIGYAPSAIFGNYVADGKHIIHETDSSCFEVISSSELIILGPFATLKEVRDEIGDGDNYLEGFSICAVCCSD